MNKTYRKESRCEWLIFGSKAANEEIKLGCLQRIADAVEKMVASYDAMRKKAERYKRYWDKERATCEQRARQITALRDQITKLKKKNRKGD